MDDVVVDGLGQVDDVESRVHEALGVLRGTAPTEAHERVDPVLLAVLHDRGHHVTGLSAHHHAMHLIPAGSQHGSASGEDSGQCGGIELGEAVFGQTPHAVSEADEFPPVLLNRRLPEASDRCVESRGVAARREDADTLSHRAKYAVFRGQAHAVHVGSQQCSLLFRG